MKQEQSNKGFDYSYNAQAVVDSQDQIIVAAEERRMRRMTRNKPCRWAQAALNNLNAAGIERPTTADGTPISIPNTADTGYFSEKAAEGLEEDRHRPAPSPSVAKSTTKAPVMRPRVGGGAFG